VCGREFDKYQAEIRKTRRGMHFCSTGCFYEYNQRENHSLWTGGQHERMNPKNQPWRRAVLERDKYHCRICRSWERLEVHHILPFGTHPEQRWDVGNGLTLCHSCHVGFRNKELDYAEILQFIASIPVVVWHESDWTAEGPDTAASSEVLPTEGRDQAEGPN
jgi:5-methylcytosine-specific restriction endonuclease McrA